MLRVALVLAVAGLVSTAPLFVYEASPNAGYVLTQPVPPAGPWKPLPHKKFYIGNGNQNFKFVNERQVDSYFHLLRESPRAPATASDVVLARTESPAHQQQNLKNADETADSPLPSSNNYRDENPPAANVPTQDDDVRKLSRDYFRRQHVYEKQSVGRARKPVVEANFHRSDRRPPRAQPPRGAPVKDKILHKAGVSELAHAPRGMKEYNKRETLDRRHGRDQPTRDIPRSRSAVQQRPSYAAFYGMSPDPEAPSQQAGAVGEDAAYYRGSATNFVDILTERKGAKTIGARALDDALQSLF